MKPEYAIQNEMLQSDLSHFSTLHQVKLDMGHLTDVNRGFSADQKFLAHSDDQTFFVRCYTRADEALLRRQISFMQFLKSQGFPIPAVLGDDPVYKGSLGTYVAYEYIEGDTTAEPNGMSMHQLTAAGSLLGQLHILSEQFGTKSAVYPEMHLDANQQLAVVEKTEIILAQKDAFDEVDQIVSTALPRKKEQLMHAAHSEDNRQAALLPQVMIHGDYHGGNIFFDQGTIKAVIDWEDSIMWTRAAEVHAAIAMNCKTQNTEHFNSPIDFARAELFLAAYEVVNPLSQEEKMQMVTMARLDALRLDFLLENHYLKSRRMDTLMPTDPSYWFWWENNYDQYKVQVLKV